MLKVRDVMTPAVLTLDAATDLRTAMDTLTREGVSGAPVLSEGVVVGVISAADVLAYVTGLPLTPEVGRGRPDEDEAVEGEGGRTGAWGDLPGWEEEVPIPSSFFRQAWSELPADGIDAEDGDAEARQEGSEWDAVAEHEVREIMTAEVRSIRPDAAVEAAAEEMQRRGIHRLLVVDEGKLVGIVSTTDIARAVAEHRIAHRTYVFLPRAELDEHEVL